MNALLAGLSDLTLIAARERPMVAPGSSPGTVRSMVLVTAGFAGSVRLTTLTVVVALLGRPGPLRREAALDAHPHERVVAEHRDLAVEACASEVGVPDDRHVLA